MAGMLGSGSNDVFIAFLVLGMMEARGLLGLGIHSARYPTVSKGLGLVRDGK